MTAALERRVLCPRCAAAVTLDAAALADKRVDCPHCGEGSDLVAGRWLDPPLVAARALAVWPAVAASLAPAAPKERPRALVKRPSSDEISVRARFGRWHAKGLGLWLGWLAVLLGLQMPGTPLALAFAAVAFTGILSALVAGRRERLCFEAEGLIVRRRTLGWPSSGHQLSPGRPADPWGRC